MVCPVCLDKKKRGLTKVVNSRKHDGNATRRRRVCNRCGYRFSTLEVIYSFGKGQHV
jgi:transcriptional regulator NrdR family protein